MTETAVSAKKIAGSILALTGEALMADDFETFHQYQQLPQQIETFDGRKLVTSSDQMRTVFESVRAHHRRVGVTRIRRDVTSARYVDDDNIEVVYTSFVYRDTILVQEPYPAYAMVRRIKGAWKVIYCMYAIPDAPTHSEALLNVPNEMRRPPTQSQENVHLV